jgi:hypothetical protein
MDSILVAAVFGLVFVTGAVVLWALALPRRTCPDCGFLFPKFRKPTSKQEFWWGGYTCTQCGTKVDRKGNRRSS